MERSELSMVSSLPTVCMLLFRLQRNTYSRFHLSLICFPAFCQSGKSSCRRKYFTPSSRCSLQSVLCHHLIAFQLETIKYLAHPFGVDDALHYACEAPLFSPHPCRARTLFSPFPSQNALCKRSLRQVTIRISNRILPSWYAPGVAIAIITF